jgi:sulfatase modifying factor 1
MKSNRLFVLLFAALSGAAVAVAEPAPVAQRNSLGMSFVRIPAGSFAMGANETVESFARDFPGYEAGRLAGLADEGPVHTVLISRAFDLGQHEVTVGQFRAFLKASGHVPGSIADGTGGYGFNAAYDPATTVRRDAFQGRDPRYSWQNPGFAQTDDHPVVNVTWNDAVAMAQWLSRKEGRVYRLPTEAEWEYACRAGTRTRYHSGDAPVSLAKVANTFDLDSAVNWSRWSSNALPVHDGYAFTSPVGRFQPNAWGVYDMHGNAWEWTADWHGDTYYAESPAVDPKGPPDGEVRVRRGGSWHTWALYARSSFRNWNTPQTRYPLVGMRLVREVPPRSP